MKILIYTFGVFLAGVLAGGYWADAYQIQHSSSACVKVSQQTVCGPRV